MKIDRYQDPYLPGHGDRRYAVRHYDLALDVGVVGNHVSATAKLTVEAREEIDTVTLDLRAMTVRRVVVDGKAARRWRHSHGRLSVGLGHKLKPGATVTIEIGYSGNPKPVPGIHGAAGWEELSDGITVASQPQGAPSWYPCNDYPGDKATYRIRVGADQAYRVVSNGVLTGTSRRPSRPSRSTHRHTEGGARHTGRSGGSRDNWPWARVARRSRSCGSSGATCR